jgi:hypothetical protein
MTEESFFHHEDGGSGLSKNLTPTKNVLEELAASIFRVEE